MGGKWGNYNVVDPHEMSCRFTSDDGLASIDTFVDEISDESKGMLDRVRTVMDKLPPIESDFVELYFFKKMKQTAISRIFRVSQPTVCYRLQRATLRIKFLLEIPDLSLADIRDAVTGCIENDLDRKIMILMAHTTCQSETAKRLGISQGMVRYRFFRSLSKIEMRSELKKFYNFFVLVSNNLNKMRELSLMDNADPINRIID